MNDPELVTVRLLGLPLKLHARAQEHGDELLREFQLLAEQLRDHPDPGMPVRLSALVTKMTSDYSSFTTEQEATLDDAVASGKDVLPELVYRVPAGVGEAARELGDMLDEADEFCRRGRRLLTLATPEDLVAYRRWYLDEFVRQPRGEPPCPWPQSPFATPGATAGKATRS